MQNIVYENRKDTIETINNEVKNLYKKKIEIKNIINNKLYGDKREYELIFNMDKFYPKNLFMPQFFVLLWENPEIVAHILMDSNPKEIITTLIPLIGNNFYENILSSKYLQNVLIYIIGLLLKNEIKKLNNENNPEIFLNNNSTCGFLLYELRTKTDSQIFLRKVIEEVVSNIDVYQYNLCFDIKKINENISNQFIDIKH